MIIVALLTYVVPYLFIPLYAMPLAVAIGTIYHNIQYFGFIWMFERNRAKRFEEKNLPIQLPQKLVLKGSWGKFFGLSLIYSFAIVGFYLVAPFQLGLVLIYYVGFAHYIIDGLIWKKANNMDVELFLDRPLGKGKTNISGGHASTENRNKSFDPHDYYSKTKDLHEQGL